MDFQGLATSPQRCESLDKALNSQVDYVLLVTSAAEHPKEKKMVRRVKRKIVKVTEVIPVVIGIKFS